MSSELAQFGKHLIVGLSGTKLSSQEKRLLKQLAPLGIILFAKNIEPAGDLSWTEPLFRLVDDAREGCGRENFIVSIDHEGGRVHRFPSVLTRFSPAARWEEYSREIGLAMGTELAAIGVTLSFAPVLDIHSEPTNPVIGERALSSDPLEVATRGLAVFHGLEAAGIVACGKHFPGHGATTQDSHHVLPRLEVDLETLSERELVPFQGLSNAGIPLLMSAHVVYPALDPTLPATLSSKILTQILRDQLHYQKALVTDDLEMKALAKYTPGEKAILALEAGNDILLEANPSNGAALDVAETMLRALADKADAGRLDLSRSAKRVDELLKYHERLKALRDTFKGDLSRLNSSSHAQLAQAVGGRVIKVEAV